MTKLPYHLVTPSPFRLYRRATELPDFWDSQNLTSSGKPCVRPLKKLPYKVYIFLVFCESKKYFKGTLFSLKMQYLNKQGQQASSKILKHPDEVITRWRSYTIWRTVNLMLLCFYSHVSILFNLILSCFSSHATELLISCHYNLTLYPTLTLKTTGLKYLYDVLRRGWRPWEPGSRMCRMTASSQEQRITVFSE